MRFRAWEIRQIESIRDGKTGQKGRRPSARRRKKKLRRDAARGV
jgi:hypothetical protein